MLFRSEMKIIHIPDLLSGVSAYAADRCRSFIGSIRPQADEGNLGVIFRWCLCTGQRIDLVVGAVLFLDDAIVSNILVLHFNSRVDG